MLDPAHSNNVYDEMRLLPESKRSVLGAVKVRVLNWHAFQPRDRLGDLASSDAKKLIRGGRKGKDFESMSAVLGSGAARVPDRQEVRSEGVRAQR